MAAQSPARRSKDLPTGMERANSIASEASPAAEASGALAIANRLRPVLLRLNRSLRGEAHEQGVTSTQASLLYAINHFPGIGPGELAARERMGAPTLVAHIDKLESAGLVERARSDPNDRRRVDLTITPAGLQVLRTLTERRTAWLAARLATLSPEDLAVIEAAIAPLEQLAQRREEERQA
jgi:DNA-binding MarR family transcriptional regulator